MLFEDLIVHVPPSLLYFASVRTKIKFLVRTLLLKMFYHLRVCEFILILDLLLDLVFLFHAYSITINVLARMPKRKLFHSAVKIVRGFQISTRTVIILSLVCTLSAADLLLRLLLIRFFLDCQRIDRNSLTYEASKLIREIL